MESYKFGQLVEMVGSEIGVSRDLVKTVVHGYSQYAIDTANATGSINYGGLIYVKRKGSEIREFIPLKIQYSTVAETIGVSEPQVKGILDAYFSKVQSLLGSESRVSLYGIATLRCSNGGNVLCKGANAFAGLFRVGVIPYWLGGT